MLFRSRKWICLPSVVRVGRSALLTCLFTGSRCGEGCYKKYTSGKKISVWGTSLIEETKQKAPVEVYRDDWNVLTESMSYETRTHVLSLTF